MSITFNTSPLPPTSPHAQSCLPVAILTLLTLFTPPPGPRTNCFVAWPIPPPPLPPSPDSSWPLTQFFEISEHLVLSPRIPPHHTTTTHPPVLPPPLSLIPSLLPSIARTICFTFLRLFPSTLLSLPPWLRPSLQQLSSVPGGGLQYLFPLRTQALDSETVGFFSLA